MSVLRKLLGRVFGKTRKQVLDEVHREPVVVEANKALERKDRILDELQILDRRRSPRAKGSAWNH